MFVWETENNNPKTPMKLPRLLLPPARAPHWPICEIIVASALIWPLSGKAHAAAYTFTNIADSDGIFAPAGNNIIGIGTAPLALNNAGMIAFTSRLDDGGRGVFTGDGVSIQTIALTSGPIFSVLDSASINSAGTVAFFGILDSGVRGVFTSNGGQITNIALNTEPTFDRFGFPAVNDAGTVGFQVRFTDGSRGILTRGGGSTVTIAAESGPIFSGVGGGNLSINSAGTVAFFAALENGQAGYFASNGGAPTTIAFGNLFPDGLSLNDAGNASFIFGGAVYTGNGGALTTVAETSGPFAGFGT